MNFGVFQGKIVMTSHEKNMILSRQNLTKSVMKWRLFILIQLAIYKIVNVCFGVNKMMEAACKIEGMCDK